MNYINAAKVFLGKREFLQVLIISILGLALRFFQLGKDSLWFDEIGVALIIRSQNIYTLLESVRSHVMAMPLDYVIGWLFTQSCESEACLRLPSVLWGGLSIPICYILFRQQVEIKIALLGSLLLVLSPLHIQYSQELRFYSSLTFFYVLSTLLLIRAIKYSTFWRWLSFTIIVIVGTYFHIYVYLSFINGFLWTLFSEKELLKNKKILGSLLTCFLAASFAIFPGYLYFKSATDYGMFSFAEAVVNIMIGFGWLPVNLFPLQIGFIWFPLFLFCQLLGFRAFYYSRNKTILIWIFSSLIQVGIVFMVNFLTQYALRGRQLLFITPLFCLLAAKGIFMIYEEVYNIIARESSFQNSKSSKTPNTNKHLYFFSIVTIGVLISILSLQAYYGLEKSRRKEISSVLIQKWKPGEGIWFTPEWESEFYEFYINLMGHPEVGRSFIGIENIQLSKNSSLPICWVTDSNLLQGKIDTIQKAGFRVITPQSIFVSDSQILLCR